MLTKSQIHKIVEGFIGVKEGYLGDFSYKTHRDFYPLCCDLDIYPDTYEGTTRERFIKILESQNPRNQAKILRGVLDKYPPEYFSSLDENNRSKKERNRNEILAMIAILEGAPIVETPSLVITSEVVDKAIQDAKILLEKSGAVSAVDRTHTAFHGYLKAICKKEGILSSEAPDVTELFKLIKSKHPKFKVEGTRKDDIEKVLNSLSNIVNVLNPIRNNASLSHPNEKLLEDDEAMLVINATQTLLHYLNSKLGK